MGRGRTEGEVRGRRGDGGKGNWGHFLGKNITK